jgi:hypothetical protein
LRQPATPVISALGALGRASQGDIVRPGVFSAINWREGHIDANNHKSHRRAWRTRRDVFWISPAGARAVLPLSAATASPPGYYGGYYGAPPPPPPGYYGGGYYRPQHWNGCPRGFTVQDGVCKPYRGY